MKNEHQLLAVLKEGALSPDKIREELGWSEEQLHAAMWPLIEWGKIHVNWDGDLQLKNVGEH